LAAFELLLFACLAPGQQKTQEERAAQRTAQFSQIARELRISVQSDAERYTPEFRDNSTAKIRELLAQQIMESLSLHGQDVGILRDKLRALDPHRKENKEYTNSPYAMSTKILEAPTVITAYLLSRGGDGAPEYKSIIQAYRKGPTGWALVAETGDELDRHTLIIVELPARQASEACFVAHGFLSGFNGRKSRIRGYCFDGEKFTTIWSPPDRLSLELTVDGTTINMKSLDEYRYYELRQPPYTRVEQFALTPGGVIHLSTSLESQ
jgi:hypothetical protein